MRDRVNVAALAAWAAVVAASCSDARSQPSSAPLSTSDTTEMVRGLAALTGVATDERMIADWSRRIAGNDAAAAAVIDEMLVSSNFGREVVPELVFGQFVGVRNYYALPSAFVLKRQPNTDIFYLRDPCTLGEAIKVRPWWNLSSEVNVCPDSYRPDKWSIAAHEHSYRTQTVLTCDSQVGSPELETKSLCGCGPNLIRCLRDEKLYGEMTMSFIDEVKRTTAHVVERDLPMSVLFTTNETVRDANVELYYRRQKIGALEITDVQRELADLAAWPREGRLAPRPELRPGQHAGMLTTPQVLHWLPDRRQRQRGYYELMWCNLRNSFGATTSKVLELNKSGNNFFTHDSWEHLAKTELCTNCHARLDYGARFFQVYPDSRASTHYAPSLYQEANGPLYGREITDPRGEAALTPLGFANLATAQPEFSSCMTSQIANYVLGDRATNDDLQAIRAAVEQEKSFKRVFKVALTRYMKHWRAPARPVVRDLAPVAPASRTAVQIVPALREQLDTHCIDCHGDDATRNGRQAGVAVDLRGQTLPRELVVRMTDMVAFGGMPKDQVLDPDTREVLVKHLLATLWADPTARNEAERYFVGRSRALPAQQFDVARRSIENLTRAPAAMPWGALERGIWSDQATVTPGFVTAMGLTAIRGCSQKAGPVGPAFEDCLQQATSLGVLSRWPRATP